MSDGFALYHIDGSLPFPHVSQALVEPDGLLAWGGDLSVKRLLEAYSQGIFPWYDPSQPILWWSPSERMVLACKNLRISQSLRKTIKKIQRQAWPYGDSILHPLESTSNAGFIVESSIVTSQSKAHDNHIRHEVSVAPDARALPKQNTAPQKSTDSHRDKYYEIKLNTAFTEVMRGCAGKRRKQDGTWISDYFIDSYSQLHALGYAHSVETWCDGKLVGGLYGVKLGQMFFGESMFSHQTDASKIALIFAVNYLVSQGIHHIDCQQDTAHLRSLGATTISREAFAELLAQTVNLQPSRWKSGIINPNIIKLKQLE